jgi:hypothetical protein
LDDEGHISEQGSYSKLSASGGHISTLNLSPPDWKYDPDEILPVTEVPGESIDIEKYEPADALANVEDAPEEDPSRRMGDISVYYYYIQAVGWLPTLIFVIGICGFVVCFSLPGKIRSALWFAALTFLAIWVKWWAAANAIAPNKNMSYYLGIYGLIGALALICLMGSCW